MKHLSKFEAKQVAHYIRSQYEVIQYAYTIADQIENMAQPDGMIFHFAVSDAVGKDWMPLIESKCPMHIELERA